MMKYLIIIPVKLYQWLLSPLLGKNCRYNPTCSSYMIQAVEAHGVKKGVVLGIKRFSKCHPFAKTHWNKTGGYDPVPKKQKK